MRLEELERLQKEDGSFGYFHSMSNNIFITTEKALRRFFFLGLNNDNQVVNKCLEYIRKCLYKEIIIPDRREKVINWDVFEELMFCAWLKLFNYRDSLIEKVISRWKNIIEKSVVFGKIDYEEYKKQYRLEYGRSGVREISISNFYMVCLLKDVLDEDIKSAYFNYVMEKGIYYIYDNNLFELPHNFDSKQTINYLVAIKLISFYANKGDLDFVYEYLMKNRNEDGLFEMPNLKADGIIFPLESSFRKKDNKIKDINIFINDVISFIRKS